jgi:hypothetical protein
VYEELGSRSAQHATNLFTLTQVRNARFVFRIRRYTWNTTVGSKLCDAERVFGEPRTRLKLLTNALAGQVEFWPPDRTVR